LAIPGYEKLFRPDRHLSGKSGKAGGAPIIYVLSESLIKHAELNQGAALLP
jgi:hypothetical protein